LQIDNAKPSGFPFKIKVKKPFDFSREVTQMVKVKNINKNKFQTNREYPQINADTQYGECIE
jgi:hypothetical protein